LFDLLKKKIGAFVSSIAGIGKKQEEKPVEAIGVEKIPEVQKPEAILEEEAKTIEEPTLAKEEEKEKPVKVEPEKFEEKKIEFEPFTTATRVEEKRREEGLELIEKQMEGKAVEKAIEKKAEEQTPARKEPVFEKPQREEPKIIIPKIPEIQAKQIEVEREKPVSHQPAPTVFEKSFEEKEEVKLKPSVGIVSSIKSFFSGKVVLKESDLEHVLSDLELALLESDVSIEASAHVAAELKKKVVGKPISKDEMEFEVKKAFGQAITELFSDYPLEAKARNSGEKPFVVLFTGPNGAGKTTTIAKIAHLMQKKGLKCVLSASDTFRAAAIEQLEIHGNKLGAKVIKHGYKSDPAAVAFDAIKHAQGSGAEIVLIDTAGRQETSKNLVEEMKKIARVCKPHAKLFIGEAIAGKSIVDQVKSFDEAIGIDAIILTKLDCDAKGGNAISIAYETKKPIAFVGLGESYDALVEFTPDFVAKQVLEAS
jgi:fused signal recognition particle receptor